MSKRINVNPDHYKSAGRERQGENIVHEEHKRHLALQDKMRSRQRAKAQKQSAGGARTKSRKP